MLPALTAPSRGIPLTRLVATACLLVLFAGLASAAKTLDIYFIDVEGGQSTLIVTPAGQSMLIDAGYAARGGRGPRGTPPPPLAPGEPGRDPSRIVAVIRQAGLQRLDYLLVTHYHPDHVGGVPEVVSQIPVGTFIDYGAPLDIDRMTAGGFRNYEPVRATGLHLEARPGERIPLKGIDADIVSAGGALLSKPLPGGGVMNPACEGAEDHPEDGTENFRSVGVMFRFGAFRFLDLGDLSGNTLTALVCPRNLLGTASAYLIAHHGDYDSNVPALYAALRPRVAIMNNGLTRGGSPDAFKTLLGAKLEDLWQLHRSGNPGAENTADERIANIDEGATAFSLKLSANEDGSFAVTNLRTNVTKSYRRQR